MTFLDLFSGIGGFRRGLERSGHTCVGHVEIDKYANKSYMAMYELAPCPYREDAGSNFSMMCKPEVRKNCDGKNCKGEWYAKDIKQIRAGEIPKAEIWTFGFPCTDISIAGRMEGLRGSRSGLFFTVVGLLKSTNPEDRPQQLIVENVKHLLSSERGGAFTTVLTEIWEAGYDCEWQAVNSKDFLVPQHRERVYLVGHFGGIRGRKVFPIGGANTAPVKQLIGGSQGKRVYDISGVSVTLTAEGGGFAGRTGLYAVSVNRREGITGAISHAHTLTASDFRGLNRNQDQNAVLSEIPPCEAFTAFNQDIGRSSHAGGIVCLGNTNPSGNGMNGNVYDTHGLSPTLTTNKGEGLKVAVPAQVQTCAAFIDMNEDAELTENARCIRARQYSGIGNHRGETSGIFLCHGHPDCVMAVITPDRMEKRQNGRRFKEPGEPSFTLTTQDQHGILLCCCEGWKDGLPIREDKKDGHTMAYPGDGINLAYPNSKKSRGRVGRQCSQTLMTGGSMGVLLCCRIRRLTPRECWRLQAFEDYLFDRVKAAGISDAQLYRQAGNAVTVNIVYEIGLRLPGGGR
ncbi:MAG: DNA (cytosine-5-)-methyltransferase [Porticoccaceae bacterium]|nr:DNA (cytosine-5-)-methyltransferase [Oscillospiraceae bacterium]